MRILVCGGRDYSDAAKVFRDLDALHAKRGITLIIEGGATGADRLARDWAISRNVPFVTEHADWKAHGKAAGPIRNALMLSKHAPDGVVAFPGGRGTLNMIALAIEHHLVVWRR